MGVTASAETTVSVESSSDELQILLDVAGRDSSSLHKALSVLVLPRVAARVDSVWACKGTKKLAPQWLHDL
jgi:hypothetical protein